MMSPPTTRLNTRLTKTRIFPTMVMVHPPWVGPPLPGPSGSKPRGPLGAGAFRRSLLPRERAGWDYAACRMLCQRDFVPLAKFRSFAGGLSSQLLDTLVQALPQFFQVLQLDLVVQPLRPQFVVLGLDHRQFDKF